MPSVSGNVCSKVHVNILKRFFSYSQTKCFSQISKSKKGHNSIIMKARIMLLAAHVCSVSGNVCFKFHVNSLNGFRVMDKVNNFLHKFLSKKGAKLNHYYSQNYALSYTCVHCLWQCVFQVSCEYLEWFSSYGQG